MSSANRDPKSLSFAYHGQAVGLSASLTKPCCENIPSLATASLSSTGGESYSTVRNYNWKGLISFEEASAYATGSKDHGMYNTLSTVTVKNLNVANMVHADLVVARVTAKHKPGDPEGQVTFTGSMIRNLVIAGREIDVVIDDKPFTDNPTYASFSKQLKSFRPSGQMWADRDRGVISCSLATRVGDQEGFKMAIPEFGTIYVAQVLLKPSYRRISMLRFELGCPIGGMLEAAGGETNGVEYWP
ncbi:MAG TPA: choice-of-anchor P family protein [Thermoanaerobaculia bacterium]|jgi:hypothetical protein